MYSAVFVLGLAWFRQHCEQHIVVQQSISPMNLFNLGISNSCKGISAILIPLFFQISHGSSSARSIVLASTIYNEEKCMG